MLRFGDVGSYELGVSDNFCHNAYLFIRGCVVVVDCLRAVHISAFLGMSLTFK